MKLPEVKFIMSLNPSYWSLAAKIFKIWNPAFRLDCA